MPSPPDVKPRQRLTPISKTCENAIVDRAKYGPFRRLDRKPMMKPAPIESTPMPKNDAWPIETWPA